MNTKKSKTAKMKLTFTVLFSLFLFSTHVSAETKLFLDKYLDTSCCLTSSYLALDAQSQTDKDFIKDRRFKTSAIITSLATSLTAYGFYAWWDRGNPEFHIKVEGWFGADTPAGGADKLGHAYSYYISSRLMKQSFEWAGHDRYSAARLASITAAVFAVGVEFMDGVTERYGLSFEDMVMNVSGIAVGMAMEFYPNIDKIFDIRLMYWRSPVATKKNQYDFIGDYSGQTYFLVTKASGIPLLAKSKWLRYLEFHFGYGTRGYTPIDGTGFPPRTRNLYYGVSINFSELLNDTLFKHQTPRKRTAQKITSGTFEFVQIPGSVLLQKKQL